MQAFARTPPGRPRPPHQFFIIELRSDRHFSLSSGRSLARSLAPSLGGSAGSATFSPLTASGAPSSRSLLPLSLHCPASSRRCTADVRADGWMEGCEQRVMPRCLTVAVVRGRMGGHWSVSSYLGKCSSGSPLAGPQLRAPAGRCFCLLCKWNVRWCKWIESGLEVLR